MKLFMQQIRILISRFFVSQYPLLFVDSIVIDNCFCDGQSSKGNNSKSIMTELLFLHSARRLRLVDTCIKFRDYSLRAFQIIEQTRFL